MNRLARIAVLTVDVAAAVKSRRRRTPEATVHDVLAAVEALRRDVGALRKLVELEGQQSHTSARAGVWIALALVGAAELITTVGAGASGPSLPIVFGAMAAYGFFEAFRSAGSSGR